MKWFKTLLGVATAAALIPYKYDSTEADGEKKVTVESLVYRLEVTPKQVSEDGTTTPAHAHIELPADGIRKVIAGTRSFVSTVKEKATAATGKAKNTAETVREKVTEGAETVRAKVGTVVDGVRTKVGEVKARRAARHAEAEDVPVEDIVVEEAEAPVPEDVQPTRKRKKPTEA